MLMIGAIATGLNVDVLLADGLLQPSSPSHGEAAFPRDLLFARFGQNPTCARPAQNRRLAPKTILNMRLDVPKRQMARDLTHFPPCPEDR